jgi:hypothetical protein
MRVAEDTVWYDDQLVKLFTKCLEESHAANSASASTDLLEATDARDLFLQYLRRSLLNEIESNSIRSLQNQWSQLVNYNLEKAVFSESLSKSLLSRDVEEETKEDQANTPNRTQGGSAARIRTRLKPTKRGEEDAKQLTLFKAETGEVNGLDAEIRQSLEGFIPLPREQSFGGSKYIVRVLWALELAARAGTGPLISADIARIIRDYGGVEVAGANVAKFLRKQKNSAEYTHLWKEDPPKYFSINSVGRATLSSFIDQGRGASSGEPAESETGEEE